MKLDLVGPSVSDDLRRLIARYGATAVQHAIKVEWSRKPGRPQEGDWLKLSPILQEDALNWLDGGDPFTARTNYSIAKEFAVILNGQSLASTRRRLYRKLRDRRRYYTFVEAEELSKKRYPFIRYFDVLRELDSAKVYDWQFARKWAENCISDFVTKFGPPPSGMTMEQLAMRSAELLPAISAPNPMNVLQLILATPLSAGGLARGVGRQ